MLTQWWKTSSLNPNRQIKRITSSHYPVDMDMLRVQALKGDVLPEQLPEIDLTGAALARSIMFIKECQEWQAHSIDTYGGLSFGFMGWNAEDGSLQQNLFKTIVQRYGEDLLLEYIPADYRQLMGITGDRALNFCKENVWYENGNLRPRWRSLELLANNKKIQLMQAQAMIRPAIVARRKVLALGLESEIAFTWFLYLTAMGIDLDGANIKKKTELKKIPDFAISIIQECCPEALPTLNLTDDQKVLLNYCIDMQYSNFTDTTLWKIAVRCF